MHEEPASTTKRLGGGMIALAWILLLALLTLLFNEKLDADRNPNRRIEGTIGTDGVREVQLVANRSGQYLVSGRINGQPVELLIDTGASDVSVPATLAKRLGLEPGMERDYQTANGFITAYATRIDRISLGPIALTEVPASINPHMPGDTVLLGMSFLRHLELTHQGNRLRLRQSLGGK